jgi:hypothetical protein
MRLDKQINGNGQPGIRQELQALANEAHAFFTSSETQRTSEMEFHNQRDKEIKVALGVSTQHLNRWMFAIAALSLVAAIFSIFHH